MDGLWEANPPSQIAPQHLRTTICFFPEGQDAENGGPGRTSIPARLASVSACAALSTEAFRYLDNKYNLDIHD